MNLPRKALKELQQILEKDYGQKLSDKDANELGVSVLRLTRVGLAVLTRLNKKAEIAPVRVLPLPSTPGSHVPRR